jgi:hypothetical protein
MSVNIKESNGEFVYKRGLASVLSGHECLKDYNGFLTDATKYWAV